MCSAVKGTQFLILICKHRCSSYRLLTSAPEILLFVSALLVVAMATGHLLSCSSFCSSSALPSGSTGLSKFFTPGCGVVSMDPHGNKSGGGHGGRREWLGWGAFGGPPALKSSSLRTRCSSTSPMIVSAAYADTAGPLPEKLNLAGVGTVTMDFLACVDSYPEPDAKIRSSKSLAQGGGNVGNALTAAALLGLQPRILSKLANDASGIGILEELKSVGVDVSHVLVSEDGVSPFTYVIVDEKTKTRTCIHTPGFPTLQNEDLSCSAVAAFLDGADLLYLDGRLPDATVSIAEEAHKRGLPIILDAERKRERLDEMLPLADYLVTSAKFPQIWTEDSTLAEAMMSMVTQFPRAKFLIVTQGSAGCLMFERSASDTSDELDPDAAMAELQKEAAQHKDWGPTVLSSKFGVRKTSGGTVTGRFLLGTAAPLSPKDVVDTTGAGDAFIGGIAYGIMAGLSPQKMLPLGAIVAAAKCQALGARTGLPHRSDPRLQTFLQA